MAPLETIRAEAQQMMRLLQNTPLMEGSGGVFYPGERSAKRRRERLANGIPVDPATWGQVESLFDQYGVRDELADVLPS
jgi:LDH2 family malate/lactate/ureidoglycolate dehydrogenase